MHLPEELRFILTSAILAPSADNQHPLRFSVTDHDVVLHYTGSGLLRQDGYKRVLALLSIGAVIENLAIAATRFGMRAVVESLPDPMASPPTVRVRLERNAVTADDLWLAIPKRHTNRRLLFRGPRLSAAEQAKLEAAAQAAPGCQWVWLDHAPLRRSALRLMRRAESERFRNRTLHEELFSAIRFDVGWRAACEEGLPPGALGVERFLRPIFTMLRHWPVMRLANRLGAHHLLGWRASALPSLLAPNMGLLAVKNTDTQTLFNAGRAMQRIWLEATRLGRVMQPLPAAALYALEGASCEGVPEALQNQMARAWQSLLPERIPLILFRIGRARAHDVHAGRPALSAYLDQH